MRRVSITSTRAKKIKATPTFRNHAHLRVYLRATDRLISKNYAKVSKIKSLLAALSITERVLVHSRDC